MKFAAGTKVYIGAPAHPMLPMVRSYPCALAGCGKRLASRNISRLLFLLSSDLGFRGVVKGRLRRLRDVIRHTEAAGYCA